MNPILSHSALALTTYTITLSKSTVTKLAQTSVIFWSTSQQPHSHPHHLVGVGDPLHGHVHHVPQLTQHYEHELNINFGDDQRDTELF